LQINKNSQAMETHTVSALQQASGQSSPEKSRLFFLDVLKAICITAVVSYHSIFVTRTSYLDSLNQLEVLFAPLRFCVPVLFTISFLLAERGMSKQTGPVWPSLRKRLLRLAIPTAFWFGLVLCLKFFRGSTPAELAGQILAGNIFLGAYYLLVLFQYVLVFPWVRGWFQQGRNVLIAVFLQGLVFLSVYILLSNNPGDAGAQVLTMLKTIGRPYFAYWFVYVALGIYFAKHLPQLVDLSKRLPKWKKTLILSGTALLMLVEYQGLLGATGGSVPPFDYVLVSCVLSVPVAFLCFACVQETHLPAPMARTVSLLANYSLGIFCFNGILSEIFLSIGTHLSVGMTFDFPAILFMKLVGWGFLLTVSLGLSMLLDRLGLSMCVR
jgi:surface polysaccharide O-acyltransferase-like enzyme